MRQNDQAEGAAQIAAERWLALIDAGDYASAWEQAGTLLKSQVGRDTFAESVRQARDAMGAFRSRALASRTYTPPLRPGESESVVVRMHARCVNKDAAIETITVHREADGIWRIGGYVIL